MIGGISVKSEILKRAAYCIFILGAITAITAFNTGEGAEEVVEKIKGIDERMIKVHEEAAETFAILLYILGGISLIGLWANWKTKPLSNTISFVSIVFAFIVLFYAKQTGTTGGEIRHTEIRTDALNSTTNENSKSEWRDND